MNNNSFDYNNTAAEAEQQENTQPETEHPELSQPEAVQPQTDTSAQQEKPVGTGVFFGLELLFSLPLIGLIASIIFSFVPESRNLKSYARAKLIWGIISLILSVFLIIGCIMLVQSVTEQLQKKIDEFSGMFDQFSDIEGIEEIVGQIGGLENLDKIIEDLGGMENIGEIIEQAGGIENIGEIIEGIGGIENAGESIEDLDPAEKMDKIAEILGDPAVIDEIVEEVSQIDGIEEAVDDMGGIDRIKNIDDINELVSIASRIKDTETREQILNVIRDRIN